MATWEDGAEYAPIERPDGFAMPIAAPLEAEPPYRAATPGPIQPPDGFRADVPAPALSTLGLLEGAARNPTQPFEVVGSVMTAETAWGAAHRDQSVFAPAGGFDPSRPIELSASANGEEQGPEADLFLPPPIGQPVIPAGAGPAPTPANVAVDQARRTIGWVAVGVLILSALLPTVAPLAWLVSGAMLLRALPNRMGTGVGIMAGGVAQAVLLYVLVTSPQLVMLSTILSFIVAATVASILASDRLRG